MNENEAKILKEQLKEAFKIAIEEVGFDNFKKISWFGSNKIQDQLEKDTE